MGRGMGRDERGKGMGKAKGVGRHEESNARDTARNKRGKDNSHNHGATENTARSIPPVTISTPFPICTEVSFILSFGLLPGEMGHHSTSPSHERLALLTVPRHDPGFAKV